MRFLERFKRKPDFVIGPDDNPYLRRWWLIPRNRHFNIYLHHFCKSDEDRALHDHPWHWASLILTGGYWEHTPEGVFWRRAWRPRWGKATSLHRVELAAETICVSNGLPGEYDLVERECPVWTIFITGPKIRNWGFACPKGWKRWQDFVSVRPGGNDIGPGCGD